MSKQLGENNKVVNFPNGGDGGGGDMDNGNYVTHKELELAKESIERKIESTEANLKVELSTIDHKIESTEANLKADLSTIDHKIETSIIDLKEELIKQKSANIRWVVGTAIALAGVLIAASKFF
ncbi:CCDC90 family protein [Melissococcus plutonius]|uniref:CCDC90 family protein n=1 Tax=Melissococcus plutonius TaxID=33970 RepID=UPI0021E5837A|nr:CCDC90 family protein [Melissococcus plutonius]MCV2498197.1 CCDC90 family protein [Melissococcus plutonius]MCV2501956.1 CCDC90 family protein [Melissococcus plutonius]MCV2506812.1 CCDC90 family protein [Melissococcus plutonius]MCV2527148.1 CCDC90 family protein [Melissococcus plutonius]